MAQKFNLENIYSFDQNYINELLKLNGQTSIDPLTDRLNATILLYNGGYIVENDRKYVPDDIFSILYMYPDQTLITIAQNNDIIPNVNKIELIRKMINKYNSYTKNELNNKFVDLARRGDMIGVVLLLYKGAHKYEWAMNFAAQGGHMDIVLLMLELGASNYNMYMSNAALGGHMDIVQLMMSKGAKDYNLAMEFAATRGHIDIVQFMLNKGANNYNKAMADAANGGYINIVQLMLNRGANNYKEAMERAEQKGHQDIVRLLETY